MAGAGRRGADAWFGRWAHRGRPGAWRAHVLRSSPAELVRVGKNAQEQFLEYAHYLPERSVLSAVERQKLAAYAALEGTALTQPLSAEQARPAEQGGSQITRTALKCHDLLC